MVRMGNPDRPQLTLEDAARLETAWQTVTGFHSQNIRALRIRTPHGENLLRMYERRGTSGEPPAPPPWKQPAKLQLVLIAYAKNLYMIESSLYRDGPRIRIWLETLREKVIRHVMKDVEQIDQEDRSGQTGLTPHGVSKNRMRSAMREALNQMIESRLASPKPSSPPPPAPGEPHTSPLLRMALASRGGHPQSVGSDFPVSPSKADTKELASAVSERRRIVIRPLLDERGWSILDWANAANVAYHTAADYLEGKTAPYPSTRKKLANSLGLSVQQFPK